MSKQIKEDKIIEDAVTILNNFRNTLSDDVSLEYEKLLTNYTRLVKRYKKVIKQGDAFNTHLVKSNESSQKIARTKIMSNISEQRKVKEKLSLDSMNDKKRIKQLLELYQISQEELIKLQKKEKDKTKHVQKHLKDD